MSQNEPVGAPRCLEAQQRSSQCPGHYSSIDLCNLIILASTTLTTSFAAHSYHDVFLNVSPFCTGFLPEILFTMR